MKLKFFILLFSATTITGFSQLPPITDIEITEIEFYYQSSFGDSDQYLILMDKREVYYISIFQNDDGTLMSKKKKIRNKKWKTITELIDKSNLSTLESTTNGIDGGWYKLKIKFSNGQTRNIEVWSRYVSDELIELHKILG
jgi:hypothetical protein